MSMLQKPKARSTRNRTHDTVCCICIILAVWCMAGCALHQQPLSASIHGSESDIAIQDAQAQQEGPPTPGTHDQADPLANDQTQQPGESSSLEDARTFARQVQELGDQLMDNLPHQARTEPFNRPVVTVLPFTPLDPTRPPSILGTYVAMQLTTRCAQQGVGPGEKMSAHADGPTNPGESFRIEGTYHVNAATLTLSARLINQRTGRIVHAATRIMAATPFVRGLLQNQSQQDQQEHTVIPIREYQ